jgi:hypothetical protein
MKQIVKISVLLVLVLAVAGCTTFRLSGVQMVEDMPSMQPLGDFEITVKVNEFLGAPAGANLFNVTSTAMDDRIYDSVRREIQRRSGDAAINVTVEYKASFIDILLSGVTFNLWAPATAVVSGTVVSYN